MMGCDVKVYIDQQLVVSPTTSEPDPASPQMVCGSTNEEEREDDGLQYEIWM